MIVLNKKEMILSFNKRKVMKMSYEINYEIPVVVSDSENLLKLPTTSSKIRFLNEKGYTRYQISKMLNIRYQHVRNVLITPIKNERK